jgi:HEAT repeat protein
LGDKATTERLHADLKAQRPGLPIYTTYLAAIGLFGDRRSIEPLLADLLDPDLSALARAFVAFALGEVGASDPLPWDSALAANVNYRAATATLRNRSNGVLDQL